MSYEKFYGLKELPFAIAPDPRFFFENEEHMGALIRMQHAIDSANGLTVLVGGLGVGKTFLSRKLLDIFYMSPEKYKVILLVVVHHEITPSWFLKKMALNFGISKPHSDKPEVLAQIHNILVENEKKGIRTAVLIDEAHMFKTKEIYGELRGLLNLEISGKKLFNIVLFGPPELEENIKLDPSFHSRVGLKFKIKPFNENVTHDYIEHRLKVAGASRQIFTKEAKKVIFKFTKGVPRLINAVCDNALLEGLLLKKKMIELDIAAGAASDLGLKEE